MSVVSGEGTWLILQAAATFVAKPLYTVALTMYNGPGKCQLSIGMHSGMIITFFSGCFMLIIACCSWNNRYG